MNGNFLKQCPVFNVQEAIQLYRRLDSQPIVSRNVISSFFPPHLSSKYKAEMLPTVETSIEALYLPYSPMCLIFNARTLNTSEDIDKGFIDAASIKAVIELTYAVKLEAITIAEAKRTCVCGEIYFFHPEKREWYKFSSCLVNPDGTISTFELQQPASSIAIFQKSLFALDLLNCKNTSLEEYNPMEHIARPQRRARERKNIQLLQYKILHINPFRQKQSHAQTETASTQDRAVHSVRGHFKTFTAEHPAFGKPWGVGTFWTGPYVCGNPEFGMIWKDYHVEIEVSA